MLSDHIVDAAVVICQKCGEVVAISQSPGTPGVLIHETNVLHIWSPTVDEHVTAPRLQWK